LLFDKGSDGFLFPHADLAAFVYRRMAFRLINLNLVLRALLANDPVASLALMLYIY
jgi:hypothetical protein